MILTYLLLLIPLCRWGPGISPDSVGYLSVAESLAHGKGYMQYDGAWMTNWPWLFPVLLSSFKLFPLPLSKSIIAFNIGAAFFTFYYTEKKLRSLPAKWLLAALFLLPPFVKMYVMLWSEAIFVALLIPFLYTYQKQEKSTQQLLILTLLGALLCELRYAGIPIVFGLIIWEWITNKRITRTSLSLLLSLIPVITNLWWNRGYEMTILSNNTQGHQLQHFIHNYTQHYTTWIGFTVLIILILLGFIRFKKLTSKAVLFAFIPYWLLVLCFAPLKPEECLRYALPALPIFICIIDQEELLNQLSAKAFQYIILLLLPIVGIYIVYITNNGTGGYNKISWHRILINKGIIALPQQTIVYSNAPDLVYYQTHHQAKLWKTTTITDSNTVLLWVDGIDRTIPLPSEVNQLNMTRYAGFSVYKWK